MTTLSLRTLFTLSLRRRLALLAAMALCVGGVAQAAHFHKSEPVRGADVHLQCLLCAHADRVAGPTVLPRIAPTVLRLLGFIGERDLPLLALAPAAAYQARGPPLA